MPLPQSFWDNLPNRSDQQLKDIIAQPNDFLPEAIDAARQELKSRGITTEELTSLDEQGANNVSKRTEFEKQEKKKHIFAKLDSKEETQNAIKEIRVASVIFWVFAAINLAVGMLGELTAFIDAGVLIVLATCLYTFKSRAAAILLVVWACIAILSKAIALLSVGLGFIGGIFLIVPIVLLKIALRSAHLCFEIRRVQKSCKVTDSKTQNA